MSPSTGVRNTAIHVATCLAALAFLTCAALPRDAHAQARTRYDAAQVMRAAMNDFSGTGATKSGPLAKVGLDLALLYEQQQWALQSNQSIRVAPLDNGLHLEGGDQYVVVDVTSNGDPNALAPALTNLGMIVTGTAGHLVSGRIPISAMRTIAAMSDVRAVAPSRWTTQVGSTTSQGDSVMHSSQVRNAFGIDGTGVTVGVLSDSYNFLGGAPADVTSGDLPGPGNPNGHTTAVNVLADGSKTDEGRAMLQLVHDVAPGAALAFATANGGQATMATNINNLRTGAGCDIIVDDVIYYAEPMFQDGVIAQAADACNAAGVPYYSSAGNQGQNAYEHAFASGGSFAGGSIASASGAPVFFGGTAHDFDPGAGTDVFQSVSIAANTSFVIVLQWDQPFASVSGAPGSASDLDFYLLNSAANQVQLGGVAANIGGDAVETISGTTGASAFNGNLMVCRFAGPTPGKIKIVYYSVTQNEWSTNSGTIYGHANANGAVAVGAAPYYNTPAFGVSPPTLEGFSSSGTTPILFTTSGAGTFDARAHKPGITAPDGTNTTFFGKDIEPDGFKNFFGTSAAAPHAAAVAALLKQADGAATPAQIENAMEATAINMDVAGFDNNTGAGLVQATAAIQNLVPCQLSCPSDITVSNDPDQCGANVSFTAPSSNTGLCGEVTVSPASGSFFPVGTTTVNVTSQAGSSCSFKVKVNDTQKPSITCPADITVECTGNNGALPTDGDIPTFLAGATASDNCPGIKAITNDGPSFYPLGPTTVTFSVEDAVGNKSSCTAKVTVVDTKKPTITVSASPNVIWPPNHKLVDVHCTVNVSDECDPNPTFVLTSIVETCVGAHDNKVPDVVGDTLNIADVNFQLRADKNPDASCDHTYTITYTASDHSGNTQTASATVVVPHDQGGHAAVIASSGFEGGVISDPTMDIMVSTLVTQPVQDDISDLSQGTTDAAATVTFDARTLLGGDLWFGNSLNLIAPTSVTYVDGDHDNYRDLVAHFGGSELASVLSTPSSIDDPLTFYYRPHGAALGGYEVTGLVAGTRATTSAVVGDETAAQTPTTTPETVEAALPRITQFSPPRPNPSSGSVNFAFDLAFGNHARVDVYDLRGARVATLMTGYQPAGRYTVTWDGRNRSGAQVPNGIYLVRADAGPFRVTRKVTLMR